MLLTETFKPYWQACQKAALAVLSYNDAELPERLYPYWRNAIHQLIISQYCPCQDEKKDKCFLVLDKETQMKVIAEKMPLLDFPHFIQMWKRAKNEFIKQEFSTTIKHET